MSVEASSWTLPPTRLSDSGKDSTFIYGVAFWLALIQVSIAASQIVLAVLILVWMYRLWLGQVHLVSLSLDGPLLAYAATSILSAMFSFDPALSLAASKKLMLLVVPYMLVSSIRRSESLETLVLVLIVVADIGALLGLWQYRFGELGDLNHRIRGFMGHYMTYSGLLMGVGILTLALLLFRRKYPWFLVASLILINAALALTLTRSAWIGMLAASILLLLLRDRRLLVLLPILGIAAALLFPRDVGRRLGSFLRPDRSSVDRLYMLDAATSMIRNHPWLGVGPDMVAEVYPIYVPPGAPHRDNLHLHNNVTQIAAERGIPCLLAWLLLILVASVAAIREYRARREDPIARALTAGAMGAILGAFLAGLFEYNFGDSEFQMLFLFTITLPFLLQHQKKLDHP